MMSRHYYDLQSWIRIQEREHESLEAQVRGTFEA